jgi:hypothetical protein
MLRLLKDLGTQGPVAFATSSEDAAQKATMKWTASTIPFAGDGSDDDGVSADFRDRHLPPESTWV